MNYSVATDLEKGQRFRTDIELAIDYCALRMDGYRYMERVHPELCRESSHDFAPLVGPVVETLPLHPDLNDNFAVFFWLQRCFRWSREHLTKYCRDHIAYDHLFLALYQHEVPEEFANMQYSRDLAGKIPPRNRAGGGIRLQQLSSDRRWPGVFGRFRNDNYASEQVRRFRLNNAVVSIFHVYDES
jgi:hypothetical protein